MENAALDIRRLAVAVDLISTCALPAEKAPLYRCCDAFEVLAAMIAERGERLDELCEEGTTFDAEAAHG